MSRVLARTGNGAVALILVLWASASNAQTVAQSFDKVRDSLKPGDTIWVTDETARETRGLIVDISQSVLVLTTDQGRHEVPVRDITRIRQRRPDPLWNGGVIGAVAGLTPLIAFCQAATESGEKCSDRVGAIAGMGALGAAAGIGIDAAIRGRKTIYLRPVGSSSGLFVSPIISSSVKGLRVSLLF